MPLQKTRPASVAGFFYPGTKSEVLETLKNCFLHPLGPGRLPREESQGSGSKDSQGPPVECFLVPHAGYVYSGPIAAHSYLKAYDLFPHERKRKARITAVIIGPNHYGLGSGVAVSPSESWSTPLGFVDVDTGFVRMLVSSPKSIIDLDDIAHSREHSIEVQVPFLQYACEGWAELSIVPVCMMLQDKETAIQVGDALTGILESLSKEDPERRFLVLGSSDLTHYEPHADATKKDLRLLDSVAKLDLSDFYSTLQRHDISACGYGPIAATMKIAAGFRRKRGILLKYGTSGDVTGDKSSVVGYPAVYFK